MILMSAPNKSRKWLDWVVAMSLAIASAGVVFWQNSRLAVLWDLSYILDTTGRHPRFPVLMFDHTVNPHGPPEIVDLARARSIQWLIVKNELQLEEEPLEKKDELIKLLLQDFESVESLDNYEIYKRKSSDSEDDTDSKDNDDESEKP